MSNRLDAERRQRLRLAGAVVLMSFLFGNNFVALDVALGYAGPITLQALAVTIATLTVWFSTRKERLPPLRMHPETIRAIVAISMALSVASPLLMVYGVERVNPAVAAMVVTTAPISTLILERVVFGRPFDLRRVFGVGLGVAGVALVVAPLAGGSSSEIVGIVVLIGASFAWAVGLILTRRLHGVVGGGRFVTWQMAAALPILYGLAFVIEGLTVEWALPFILAVGYSGIFAKGTASLLQFRTIRRSSPLYSSLAAFMVPAVATVSTYLILGESVVTIQLAGMTLIAVSIGIVIGGYREADTGQTGS